ncbi:MAG: energy transducer TonB [Candidatus Omnitrophica bacterium]|nr:energy transducer TonB [Candidatus Omnitrophota bacterium]
MSALVLNLFSKVFIHRDRIASITASVAFHIALLVVGGLLLVKPLEYGVQVGASGVEIDLVAAPTPVVEQVAPEPPSEVVQKDPDPVTVPVEKIKPAEAPAAPKPVTEINGKDQMTFQSRGGALVEAKPEYLANPAPRYPLKARQAGWQGVVVLSASVDRQGNPAQVAVERSSGYDILDQSALKAVKGWRFQPAKLGTLAVESTVKIPVRFDLKDPR